MKNPLLDLALYAALALAAGKLISNLAPEPQPTELPVRANETSAVKQSLTTPKPEPAEPSPPPQVPALVWHTESKAAFRESLDASKPLLVVFTLPKDCVPCAKFKQTLAQEEVIQHLSRFALLEVSGETAAAEWNVKEFPSVAIFRDDEAEVKPWKPELDAAAFLKQLENQ